MGEDRTMTRKGAVLFIGLGIVWGIPYLLIKVSVGELSPAALVFARTLVAAALLLPVALARGAVRPVLRRWPPLLAFTVVEIAVPWYFLGSAEQHLTSSLTGLLIAAVPLVGAGLALLRHEGERLGPVGVAGLALGLLGVAALVGLDVRGSQVGAALEVGLVVLGYALGPVILARWLFDQPGVGVMAVALTACMLGYAPFAIPALPDRWPSAQVTASVLTLGVVCTAAAFLMLFALIGEIGPVRATVITYVNPAVAVAAGVLVLDEPQTATTLVGFALIVVGSVLATRRPAPASDESAPMTVPAAEAVPLRCPDPG
jgi:drug/metabolite transporter (DMT)-like permease